MPLDPQAEELLKKPGGFRNSTVRDNDTGGRAARTDCPPPVQVRFSSSLTLEWPESHSSVHLGHDGDGAFLRAPPWTKAR